MYSPVLVKTFNVEREVYDLVDTFDKNKTVNTGIVFFYLTLRFFFLYFLFKMTKTESAVFKLFFLFILVVGYTRANK